MYRIPGTRQTACAAGPVQDPLGCEEVDGRFVDPAVAVTGVTPLPDGGGHPDEEEQDRETGPSEESHTLYMCSLYTCICVPYIYVYVELPRSNHAPTGTSCRFSTDPGLWDGPVVWTLPDGIGGRCNVVSGAGTGVPRDCRLMFVLQCR